MSTGCIGRRKHKKTPPHLNHSSKHTIGFLGVTSSEEGEPKLLDPDPAKYSHDICTVLIGPYSRVKCHTHIQVISQTDDCLVVMNKQVCTKLAGYYSCSSIGFTIQILDRYKFRLIILFYSYVFPAAFPFPFDCKFQRGNCNI